LSNIVRSNNYVDGIWQGIIIGAIGSLCSVFIVWSFHYFYAKNIFGAFERGSKDIDPSAEKYLENTKIEVDFDAT